MIGSVLNSLMGYSTPFFIIGIFFLISVIPIVLLLPNDKELKAFTKKKKLPIGKAFTSVKACVTILNIMTVTCGYIYFNPFFVNHMGSFGLSKNVAAFIMTIPSFFCI
jgi:predicted MFS family arabinose efflux permease